MALGVGEARIVTARGVNAVVTSPMATGVGASLCAPAAAIGGLPELLDIDVNQRIHVQVFVVGR